MFSISKQDVKYTNFCGFNSCASGNNEETSVSHINHELHANTRG